MKSITHNSDHQWLGIVLIIICGLAGIWAVVSLVLQTGCDMNVDSDHIDHIGSYFSGLVGIVSVYYLYRTLRSQSLSFRMSSFETRFVEMVSMQRENLKNIVVEDKCTANHPLLKGQDAVKLFISYYYKAYEKVEQYLADKEVSTIYKETKKYEQDLIIWPGDLLKQRTCANISYMITFIGVQTEGERLLRNKYLKYINDRDVNAIIRQFKLLLAFGEATANLDDSPVGQGRKINCQNKEYVGFQHEFGNYFRQLFQIVNYANTQQWLYYGDKYGYVKMLRSQFSNQEEVLLYYNSLSDVGVAWEFADKGTDKADMNKQLITKYNLLKNIPHQTTTPKVEDFYPLISYEDSSDVNGRRKEIERKYE